MHGKQQFCNSRFCTISRAVKLALTIATVFALMIVATQSAQAQTYKVLYNFTGGLDGSGPYSGLTMDRAGNLYGTTTGGGQFQGYCQYGGCGTVFKLSHAGSGWLLSPLYAFLGVQQGDGYNPYGRPVFGPDGSLYGTTIQGGLVCSSSDGQGCGTVYNLRPPPRACASVFCPWKETVLYRFQGNAKTDGNRPSGAVSFDPAGNLYGTTVAGGYTGYWEGCDQNEGCGTAYRLIPSGGSWTEEVLHVFVDGTDPDLGAYPQNGVILDQDVNLYGVAFGHFGKGIVYRLPKDDWWTQDNIILYQFQGGTDGYGPQGCLIFDPAGNLYGTAYYGGSGNGGTVLELTPSGGSWTYTLLYSFSLPGGTNPMMSLTMDAAGNLYGAASEGGAYGHGAIFKLTPGSSGWTYTALHDFTNGSDGGYPVTNVVMDAQGHLYGTADSGGTGCGPYGTCGVIWEITP